ncbi:group II intron maturase-specific domain-containing protein [Jatrophihabitans lederbergiae]|uniref:Group II intron maturase-specific domain-containing protein n=1 Tax=Jatrophihabitans lederbergiae TaxID=3075547 RepID=A0ABU2JGZ7_9ACTN|nr:group II intron maturase-specific domain-containing protein [Jatrophihabitans sp. DSM 44399]MDT0264270.1 group II intron maturase-specific domain-containing protein [Jatrophihabitans sp. DSM 44399]
MLVLVHGQRDDVEILREAVAQVLAPLGLKLSPGKTTVVHMSDGFDFLGFRIQWKRKRGTNKWYVYTFIADRPFRAVKAKIRALTHRVSQANMGTVITRINQILRGWTNYFRHAVCKHTFSRLRHFVNWRLIRWLRKRHRWRWGQFRRRFTTASGRWLPFAADGVEVFNPGSVAVTRYRYRGGTIPNPYLRPNHA